MRRLFVRTSALYAVLIFFPSPLDNLPWFRDQSWASTNSVYRPLLELAARLFDVTLPDAAPTGSGDTTADWLRMFVALALSLLLGLLWSLDAKRTNDTRVAAFARDFIRLELMVMMISYGVTKVLGHQFPHLGEFNAWDTYAESSPMGLAWRFMGHSTAYQFFAGSMELTGGLLLLTRRTTTLGALLLMVVLSNVVLMNFCFDIPVKQFSVHLLLGAVVLAWNDLARVVRTVLNLGAVQARSLEAPYLRAGWKRFILPVLFTFYAGQELIHDFAEEAWGRPFAPAVGEYVVVRSNGLPWRTVKVTPWGFGVENPSGQRRWFRGELDEAGTSVTSEEVLSLTWHPRGPLTVFEGTLDGAAISFEALRRDLSSSELESRGFHWVSEYPYNR